MGVTENGIGVQLPALLLFIVTLVLAIGTFRMAQSAEGVKPLQTDRSTNSVNIKACRQAG